MSDGLASYEVAPFVELTDEQLDAVAERHGLARTWHRLPSTGVIHTIYVLGEHVVRVAKRDPEALADIRTESVAAPVARAAGVRTPAMVAFDDSLEIVDVPYTVFELVHADALGARPFDADRDASIYRAIGRDLAVLHAGVTTCADPNGWLDEDARGDTAAMVEHAASIGVLAPDSARWLLAVLARLEPAVDVARTYRRFIHCDVAPFNVLATADAYAALIDWGDASWSDPARDLRNLHPRALGHVLAGYREVMPMDGDDTAEHRVLRDHIDAAVHGVLRPPRPETPGWARPPAARLVELLAELSTESSWARPLLSGP